MENIVGKGEIACIKQFLLFSQCFPSYMALTFHFKCALKCRLQFVSVWTSVKFCRLLKGKFIFSISIIVFIWCGREENFVVLAKDMIKISGVAQCFVERTSFTVSSHV